MESQRVRCDWVCTLNVYMSLLLSRFVSLSPSTPKSISTSLFMPWKYSRPFNITLIEVWYTHYPFLINKGIISNPCKIWSFQSIFLLLLGFMKIKYYIPLPISNSINISGLYYMHYFLLLRGNIQKNRQILTGCIMVGEIIFSQRLMVISKTWE